MTEGERPRYRRTVAATRWPTSAAWLGPWFRPARFRGVA